MMGVMAVNREKTEITREKSCSVAVHARKGSR